MASPRLQQILSEGLDTAALVLGENQQRQLLDYLDLLQRWNARFNLTAIRDPEAMVTRHLLDSLVLLPCLRQFALHFAAGFGSQVAYVLYRK